jgi:hypothetical protein
MENKYKKDFFEEDNNEFNDIMQNDSTNFSVEENLSQCFSTLKSFLSDPNVPAELKSKALAMWGVAMKENSNKMLPEHVKQNDQYLTSHILNVDNLNNSNILKIADNQELKSTLLASVKRQIAIGDFDTVVAATKAYSLENNDFLGFKKDEDEDSMFNGYTGKNLVTDEDLAKSTLSSNNAEIINSMTNEETEIMLNNFLILNDFAQTGDGYLYSEGVNEMADVSDKISEHLKDLKVTNNDVLDIEGFEAIDGLGGVNVDTDIDDIDFDPDPEIDIDAIEPIEPIGPAKNIDAPKVLNPSDQESQKNKKDDFSDIITEFDVDFIEETKMAKKSLMKESNLIQLNKIPLISSNVYAYDKDVYDRGAFKSNIGRGDSIMKINRLTGTSTIPPSSFQNSSAFDLAMMNMVLMGKKNVYLTPPKKGGLNAQKTFLESAIKSAIEVGEFDPSQIHVPRDFRKFKEIYIAQLTGAGAILDKMSTIDKNYDYKNDTKNEDPIGYDNSDLSNNRHQNQATEKKSQSENDNPSDPTESAPTESAPTESAPTESAPTESAPTESAPTESAPTESAPTESAPAESAPIKSAPAESAPIKSAPAQGIQFTDIEDAMDYLSNSNDHNTDQHEYYAPINSVENDGNWADDIDSINEGNNPLEEGKTNKNKNKSRTQPSNNPVAK